MLTNEPFFFFSPKIFIISKTVIFSLLHLAAGRRLPWEGSVLTRIRSYNHSCDVHRTVPHIPELSKIQQNLRMQGG